MTRHQGCPALSVTERQLPQSEDKGSPVRTWCRALSSSGHCHRLSLYQLDVPSHKDRSHCPRASSDPAAVTLSSISLMPTQACEEMLRSTSQAR